MTIYMIIADGELDQYCESKTDADREKRDLKEMGCTVTVKQFPSWEAAYEYEDKLNA